MEAELAGSKWRIPLLILSSILLILGTCTGPLFTRLYFLHGGKSYWLSAGLETTACPLILLPLTISYINRRRKGGDSGSFFLIKPYLYKCSAIAGLLFGLVNFFYASGSSALPVSTSALIYSSQLAFTAVFAYFLVSQRFNIYSTNTIVSLTLGAVILGFQSSSDAPEGESMSHYVMGFVLMLLAALLNAFVLPFMELAYKKAKQEINYSLVMEFNMMMGVFATSFCALGWFISTDFKDIVQEAKESDLGETNYYLVLALIAISWQGTLLGINGVIFCSSSLLSGILLTCTVPLTEVLGMIFFHEKFNASKGISLVLSIWGFLSYFYGEFKYTNNQENKSSSQLESHLITPHDDDIVC
ncbi:hypothetical protein Leryth_026625 [Lithospermum erythrorhizon]|nr:hypothetical protein Leryth_026625 [Lithospermum erythrorhizon]